MEAAHRKNYLYRIATNLANDHYRSRRTEPLPENEPASTTASSYSPDVERAFRALNPRERDALWLAYVECFSHSEIAEVLRLKTASVRPTLARAREKFARILRRRGIAGHSEDLKIRKGTR
jgi:RNA polymerase sigma-70 factor (ECF subfamily)